MALNLNYLGEPSESSTAHFQYIMCNTLYGKSTRAYAKYHEIKDFKEELEKRVKIKEDELREVAEERLLNHLQYLKDRFNNILRNEQIRTSAMLREANRDKQEKVAALRTQLESSNMAALMYVVCCERRRNDLEVAALRDEYAAYVEALEQLLDDSQTLISNLVRGYRTAGRVEEEWRGKMRGVVEEFIAYIEHFHGVCASHLFDLPALLETEAPVFHETAVREPCEDTEMETEPREEQPKMWWERLGDRPFVVFGDMSGLSPGERLAVMREMRSIAKSPAPEKWGEYAFNNLSLKDTCSNWETIRQRYKELKSPHVKKLADNKQGSDTTQRPTSQNVDYRSRMGSILKMITSTGTNSQVPKTSLLGAKDSLEILSVTKLEDLFEERLEDSYNLERASEQEEQLRESMAADSMLVVPNRVLDVDRKIANEKICPEVSCQTQRTRDFLESLPPYMRASPSTYYDMTYEQYETCTPEQLHILEMRIEELKKKENAEALTPNPLDEWADVVGDGYKIRDDKGSDKIDSSAEGVCICGRDADEKRDLSVKMLYPTKEKMDRITKEFFFDERIQFDRFKVVEQGSGRTKQREKPELTQVNELLKQYPSLCGLFEGQ